MALLHGSVKLCLIAARVVNKRLASEPADAAIDKAKWLAWFAQVNDTSRLIDTFVRSSSCDERDMAELRALLERVTQSFIEHICLRNDEFDVP